MLRSSAKIFATTTVAGRVVAVRKKTKWIDRRRRTIVHNGKDTWNFGEQPSCALCHVRFRYKQDYQAHKESDLHKNRVKWVETMQWWKETGEPAFISTAVAEWTWFEEHVLPEKAKELQMEIEDARRFFRRAVMHQTPEHHLPLQPPLVRKEVREPRDQRWPSSPKW
jgi:hypothetical protein